MICSSQISQTQMFLRRWKQHGDTLFTEPTWWSELSANREELELKKIVQAAESGGGANWNTARASKQLYKLTNVGLVQGGFAFYRQTFAYGLALFWNLDVSIFSLPYSAANAAMAIGTYEHTSIGANAASNDDRSLNPDKLIWTEGFSKSADFYLGLYYLVKESPNIQRPC